MENNEQLNRQEIIRKFYMEFRNYTELLDFEIKKYDLETGKLSPFDITTKKADKIIRRIKKDSGLIKIRLENFLRMR